MTTSGYTEPVLSVRDLAISFNTGQGECVLLRDASFEVKRGEVLGIVGESGSGKSITALSLMGLLPAGGRVSHGEAWFEGQDLFTLSPRQ